ncbi:hypothetical protein L218DRAFT_964487 [Marasmius fiardii PR-910]|nr:hypothetical protein L218DRAFT_964487 [Marasmius fiardii PR-910]
MELSLEVYRNILNNVHSRADIASLCRVSKGFRYAGERALYNTIYVQDPRMTMALCETLARVPRIALLVEAFTFSVSLPVGALGEGNEPESGVRSYSSDGSSDGESEGKDEEDEAGQEEEDDELTAALAMSLAGRLEDFEQVEEPVTSAVDADAGRAPIGPLAPSSGTLPPDYWASISNALRRTNALRHLNIHIDGPFDASNTWIFEGCSFRLKSFHCDLNWNQNLVSFLHTQVQLHDLYIIDYNQDVDDHRTIAKATSSNTDTNTRNALVDITAHTDTTLTHPYSSYPPNPYPRPHPHPRPHPSALILPNLSKLECTFSEAAVSLVPGRPITHLKTCFSKTDSKEKKTELDLLFSKIRLSTRRLRSLDIADSAYEETFSMELVRSVVATSKTCSELRYLGTVVLPIAGRERLTFYGLLMRLPRVSCVEFEVTEWDPSPLSVGIPAFKALANELRLYCPTVTRVIFVHDFERTVISYVRGVGKMDYESSPEIMWRDV